MPPREPPVRSVAGRGSPASSRAASGSESASGSGSGSASASASVSGPGSGRARGSDSGFRRAPAGSGAGVSRSALGSAAEQRAIEALGAAGYRVVERNVRMRVGELDAVAWEGDTLVFVEVRSRASARFGHAAETVSRTKQRQVARVAQAYLSTRTISPRPRGIRFDVVAITGEELVILRDAFRLA